jgi:hypothetical protein
MVTSSFPVRTERPVVLMADENLVSLQRRRVMVMATDRPFFRQEFRMYSQ